MAIKKKNVKRSATPATIRQQELAGFEHYFGAGKKTKTKPSVRKIRAKSKSK